MSSINTITHNIFTLNVTTFSGKKYMYFLEGFSHHKIKFMKRFHKTTY